MVPVDANGTQGGYDAVLVVSFGGPEGPEDVIPFLENVLRGRDVPRARLEEVAAHYYRHGGVSPLNGQNRALVAAVGAELQRRGPGLPVYWGNRNWGPFLADTLAVMRDDGVRRCLAFVTSAYSSYSGCRQYLEDLAAARAAVGAGAPVVHKLRAYFDHPGFVTPLAEGVRAARADAGPEAPVLFSAHSIPETMAAGCAYEAQLVATATLVAAAAGLGGGPGHAWQLAYQSRSGPPSQAWLSPDIRDVLAGLAPGTGGVVVAPIGFVSDHMEVVHDLDVEASEAAAARGIRLVRSATPGTHPAFVRMIRQLVEERLDPTAPRLALSSLGPSHDTCPAGHCPSGRGLPDQPAPSRPAPPTGIGRGSPP
jgi:ferrochelatase